MAERRKRFGANNMPEKKKRTILAIYLSQFKSPLIYVIVIADIIALTIGNYDDTIIIFSIIFLDSLIGFFQEYRAEKTLDALKGLIHMATVIRDGRKMEIDVSGIVPDDVVALNTGDRVPADGELLEAVPLSK